MHAFVRLFAVGLCAVAAASAVQAQTRRGLTVAPNAQPSASTRAAQAAPNPAGLRPVFPAGISSGSGALVSTSPIAADAAPVPGTTTTTGTTTGSARTAFGGGLGPQLTPIDVTSAAAATTVLGAGPTVPGPSQNINSGAGGYNATDLARSFYFADSNHDGELTRAEAGRLSIAPLSFEQMDRNFDGVISRFEYEDATR
jgi:hypothetical protein